MTEEQLRIAELEAGLQEIADANGEESFVLSSQRQITGYQQGVAAQAERAKKALGRAYKEQMPANMVLDAVKRYREALEAIAKESLLFGTHCSWCGANLRGVSIGSSVTAVHKATIQEHSKHCPTIIAREALGRDK